MKTQAQIEDRKKQKELADKILKAAGRAEELVLRIKAEIEKTEKKSGTIYASNKAVEERVNFGDLGSILHLEESLKEIVETFPE